MAGFLNGLGYFAGGVAKGIEAEAAIRAKNVASAAAAQEAARKDEDFQNEQGYNAAMGTLTPDITVGSDWDPAKAAQDAAAAARAKRNPPAKEGIIPAAIHRVAGAISGRTREATASAAGIGAPPPVVAPVAAGAPAAPAAPSPVGLGVGQPPAAAAPAPATAPDGTPMAEEVVVEAPKRTPTARERAKFEAVVASQFGKRELAQKAMDKYVNLNVAEKLKALDVLPTDEWNDKMSAMTGHVVERKPSTKDPNNFDVYIDGQMFHANTDRQGMRAIIRGQLDDDPTLAYKYGVEADDALEKRAKSIAEINLAEAQVKDLEAKTAATKEMTPLQIEEAQIKVKEAKGVFDWKTLRGDPRNLELYPDKIMQGLPTYGSEAKDPTIWETTMTGPPDQYGNPTPVKVNTLERDVAKAQTRMRNSPYRSVIGVNYGAGDKRSFGVVDPTTGQPVGNFGSFGAAEKAAEKMYPRGAAPAAAAAPTPAGSVQGKTVARTPFSVTQPAAAGAP